MAAVQNGFKRDRIRHVIVLMMENRSFDHLLGFLGHADPAYPSLERLDVSCPVDPDDPDGERVRPSADATPVLGVDPDHSHEAVVQQVRGGSMDGFIRSFAMKLAGESPRPPVSLPLRVLKWIVDKLVALWHLIKRSPKPVIPDARAIMRCFPEHQAPVLSWLAKEFAVCVNWHASVPGETWPNRNFAHAATSDGTTNIKIRFYDNETVFEKLDSRDVDWGIYHDGIPQVWAFWRLWIGSRGRFHRIDSLFDHIRKGKLPAYSFVEPNHGLLGGDANSQHPGNNTTSANSFLAGEALMARIYNALVDKPEVFAETLFLITYDEHGGFFDHVHPREVLAPEEQGAPSGFDFRVSGVRVPAVAISPLIPRDTIVPDFFEHASIPKTVRVQFAKDADPLNAREQAAADLLAKLPLLPKKRSDCTRYEPAAPEGVADVPDVPGPPTGERLNDFQVSLVRLAGAVKARLEQPPGAAADEAVEARPAFRPDRALEKAAKRRRVRPRSNASQAVKQVMSYFDDASPPADDPGGAAGGPR